MKTHELRQRLEKLSTSMLKLLAASSGVGERTLWKIRAGQTETASESVKDKVSSALKTMPRKRANGNNARV
jgi:hypothetical protein